MIGEPPGSTAIHGMAEGAKAAQGAEDADQQQVQCWIEPECQETNAQGSSSNNNNSNSDSNSNSNRRAGPASKQGPPAA